MTKKRKVLVLRLSSLGDVVHATAAFAPLRAAGCEIFFVTKPAYASLLSAGIPQLQVYAYDPRAEGELTARKKLFAWIQQKKFDFILDLHDSLRTKYWRPFLRRMAPLYIARKPRCLEWRVLALRERNGLGRGGRARLLRKIACQAVLVEFGLDYPPDSEALTEFYAPTTEKKFTLLPLPRGDFLVLVPGSAWSGKRWPESYFAELAQSFAAIAPIVVLGGKAEDYCAMIAEQAQKIAPESRSLHGQTSLTECAIILARAKLVVGNDTGLVHLAEAMGKNVVALEGPTHPALGYSVYRPGSRILRRDVSCSPCSKAGKICWRWGSRICLRGLSAKEVLRVTQEIWKQNGL